MLLAIDIGNTHATLGLYDGERLRAEWRLSTHPARTADELGALLTPLMERRAGEARGLRALTGAIIASVVPAATEPYRRAVEEWAGARCLVVGPGLKTLPIRYADPEQVGPDRVVNAVAARRLWGGAVIVADLGTATTLDVVSAAGEFLGGAICPGVHTCAEALSARGARLSRVPLTAPPAAIGATTAENIQSGLILGHAALIDGLARRMRAELGGAARVVATGGLASLIAPHSAEIEEVRPHLTLEGLRLIYEQNR